MRPTWALDVQRGTSPREMSSIGRNKGPRASKFTQDGSAALEVGTWVTWLNRSPGWSLRRCDAGLLLWPPRQRPLPNTVAFGLGAVAGREQRCGEQPTGLGWETEIVITRQTAACPPGASLDTACSVQARALQAGWSPLQVHQAGPQAFPAVLAGVCTSAPTQHLQGGAHTSLSIATTVSHPEAEVTGNG